MDYTTNTRITTPLEARHRPSGFNSRFDGWSASFADYIAHQREMISLARANANPADLRKIVDGNAPFELKPVGNYPTGKMKPYKRGILLTHGLSDSPYFMRYLAEFFQNNGFRVMAVLLPGHGTQPGDLLDVHWQEWAKTVSYGADRLALEVDDVYLGGYSAGGALSLYQSLHDSRVRGLFLFSPAFKISPKAAWAHLHQFYSWLIPSAKWVSIMPDRDIYKYESFPKNAAAQMHALAQEVREQEHLHRLNIPVFAVASADDSTADLTATMNFMMRMPHPHCKLVLYARHGVEHMHGFPEERLEQIDSVIPEHKILSYAHTSIVLPPDDPHYGAKGCYSNCTHYFPDNLEKYNICINRPHEVPQGEITEQNLADWTMRRLMYNPRFAELATSMQRFIHELP